MSLESSGADKIKSDIDRITNGLPDAVRSAIQETLQSGEERSKEVVHVVTGALRDSIRVEMQGDDHGDLVAGGTGGVDYAAIEELGNSSREGHPFLRPALESSFQEAEQKLKNKIDDLMR